MIYQVRTSLRTYNLFKYLQKFYKQQRGINVRMIDTFFLIYEDTKLLDLKEISNLSIPNEEEFGSCEKLYKTITFGVSYKDKEKIIDILNDVYCRLEISRNLSDGNLFYFLVKAAFLANIHGYDSESLYIKTWYFDENAKFVKEKHLPIDKEYIDKFKKLKVGSKNRDKLRLEIKNYIEEIIKPTEGYAVAYSDRKSLLDIIEEPLMSNSR